MVNLTGTGTGWDIVGDFLLRQVRNKMNTPTRRRNYAGQYKDMSYKLNDTGGLSESLQIETIWIPQSDVIQLALTYPDVKPFSIQGKIFFETGRRPNTRAPRYEVIDAWARRKVVGFTEKTEKEQKSFVYGVLMSIKKKGIGTYPLFEQTFVAEIQNEYQNWFNTLSDEQIIGLPGIEKVFDAFSRILIIDKPTILSITETR